MWSCHPLKIDTYMWNLGQTFTKERCQEVAVIMGENVSSIIENVCKKKFSKILEKWGWISRRGLRNPLWRDIELQVCRFLKKTFLLEEVLLDSREGHPNFVLLEQMILVIDHYRRFLKILVHSFQRIETYLQIRGRTKALQEIHE